MSFNKSLLLGATFCFGVSSANASAFSQLTTEGVVTGITRACSLATIGAIYHMLEGYIDNSAKALFFGGSTLVLLLSNYEDLKRGAVIVGLSYILGAIAYYKPLYGISIGTFSVIYPFLRDNFSCGAAGVLAALIGVTTGSICELYRLRHIQNHLH